MTTQMDSQTQQVIDLHDRHMITSYPRYPVVMTRGQGSWLFDADGKKYLDLFAGFGGGLLGHCHPDLVGAVTEQANQLWHVGNLLHTEPQARLAEAIAAAGFGGRSFFCHSGADANIAAIKLARLYGKARPRNAGALGRFKIISMLNGFHGRLFGSMEATGQAAVSRGFEPLLDGFVHVPFNNLDAMAAAIDDQTVAILVEPIQGEAGVVLPDDRYLPGLRALCDQHDLLLICDEVWTGCGRTGRYFGHQHWGVEPDVMTLAKGVGGGLAVGVMCAKPHVAELFAWTVAGGVRHATTLGGNCLAMAAAAELFEVLRRDGLVDRAGLLGRQALDRLTKLTHQCPTIIQEVRGKGLFLGVQIHPDSPVKATQIADRCLEMGLLVNGAKSGVIRLAPALTISQSELDEGLDLLAQAVGTS